MRSPADIAALPEPMLRAEQIVKQYPGTTALKGVDFNVYPGKANVLIGENGAWKPSIARASGRR
jgi:ABC-type sugar transport system ATPase subunit